MNDRLLEVAIAQFGELGFEAASTRAIAAAAGTAMSTITYRFGGKEGLYRAAVAHIAERAAKGMLPVLDNHRPGDDPVDHVVAIVTRFASMMLSEETTAASRMIVREQMAPTEAFDLMWTGVMRPVLDTLTARIGEALGGGDARANRTLALTLMGQALVFRAGRATILRALEREALGADDTPPILARLEANIRSILRRPAAP